MYYTLLLMLFVSSFQLKAEGEKNVIELSRKEFIEKVFNYEKSPNEWVYEGTKPCIIDFYASWCGPCKRLAPVLSKMADKYFGDIIVYKINVDKDKELANFFGIQSIPTVLFVPMDEKPIITQGLLPESVVEKYITESLLKK